MLQKKKKKSNFSIRRLIYNDKYLIIISIILAFIIWIIASINIGTDENKTIRLNVPITLGDEVSEQYGMQYFSIQESVDLSVTITGPKYVIGQVTENDLSVSFDSSSVNRTGVQNIPVLVSNNSKVLDFEVTSTYPSTIEAYFDVNSTKTFDVSVKYDNSKIESGYVFGTPVLSEDKVVVSGPKTYVENIDGVYVEMKFDTDKRLTEPVNSECKLYAQGLGVESNYLTFTSKADSEKELSGISVTLPVLKKTTLPVVVDIENESKDSNRGVSVWYSVNQINAGVLDSADVKRAVIGTIDYNQLRAGRNSFSFDVSDIQGITVLDDIKEISVVVTVNKSYSEQTVIVSNSNVVVEGLEKGQEATVISIDNPSLTVVSPKNVVIRPEDIVLKCDVSKPKKDNMYPAQMIIRSDKSSWIYGSHMVNIEIK